MTSNLNGQVVPDAVSGNWVDRYAPKYIRPYAQLARWDRPIGWWLLLWPCWWSVSLATNSLEQNPLNLWYLFLFLIGSIAMRGAGCTYNDIVDRNIDTQVERTKLRPIPSGQISTFRAIIFLVFQALVGLFVLVQFNLYTVVLGLCSLLVVAIYPFMKRITHWPQFVLGLAFSWGALVGWTAVVGSLHISALLLYFAAVLWTIGYDTIYAQQDKEDDSLIGIKSTALLFGNKAKFALAFFYSGCVILLATSFLLVGSGYLAFIGLLVGSLHLGWQIINLNIEDSSNCLRLFRSNRDFGWIIFVGLVLEGIWRYF